MSFISNTLKEINLKVVYFGPGLSGKTANIDFIHKNSDPENVGQLVTMKNSDNRTTFFDFLPLRFGKLGGYKTNLHIFTVPGHLSFESNRRLILKGLDGLVFVADSKKEQRSSNKEFLKKLSELLYEQGLNIEDIPFVFQYNHRDAKNIISVEDLSAELNFYKKKEFEALAKSGEGVFETLEEISKQILNKLKD